MHTCCSSWILQRLMVAASSLLLVQRRPSLRSCQSDNEPSGDETLLRSCNQRMSQGGVRPRYAHANQRIRQGDETHTMFVPIENETLATLMQIREWAKGGWDTCYTRVSTEHLAILVQKGNETPATVVSLGSTLLHSCRKGTRHSLRLFVWEALCCFCVQGELSRNWCESHVGNGFKYNNWTFRLFF